MLCQDRNVLRRWKVAVKSTGRSKELISAIDSGLPGDVKLTVRSAPDPTSHFYKQLIQKKIFTGSGKSANIVTAGLDMAVWLEDAQIQDAEDLFIAKKEEEFIARGASASEAKANARAVTKPERIYREKMDADTGLMVIYLIDLRHILKDSDPELLKIKQEERIDESIPLIGYAVGFPPISPDPGGYYVKGNYKIDEDIVESEEFDEETLNSDE